MAVLPAYGGKAVATAFWLLATMLALTTVIHVGPHWVELSRNGSVNSSKVGMS